MSLTQAEDVVMTRHLDLLNPKLHVYQQLEKGMSEPKVALELIGGEEDLAKQTRFLLAGVKKRIFALKEELKALGVSS